ncbi:MAG: DUF1559 domain-containing protein [Planctomycetaceae bacterium]|jgi:prepilin-type N-terminal cleavage/methylation domain-containing protein|nr:DUF1559 domain-containing protein [Planctomycetaceae bacterium]
MTKPKIAFTLVELLVVISIISVLFALLFPAVQSVRESSRRLSCANKLRQLAISAVNYHDVYDAFPSGCDRYGSPYDLYSSELGPFGTRRTSGFVRLLPYLEQVAAFDAIASQMNNPSGSYLQTGLQAGFIYNRPQCYSIQNFPESARNFDANFMACPSDPYSNKLTPNGNICGYSSEASSSRSGNFVQSVGDVVTLFSGMITIGTQKVLPNGRGPIGKYFEYSFNSVTDGASNTAIYTERCAGAGGVSHTTSGGNIRQFVVLNAEGMLTNYSDGMYTFSPLACMASYTKGNYIKSEQLSSGFAGTAWYDGWSPYSWATFITPPNSTSCFRAPELVAGNNPYGPGIFPPTSYHPNGVNVAKTDGSVIFVTDDVYCGDKLDGGTFYDEGMTKIVSGKSEFGVWGSLGSKDGND